jgi:hypothetical protein
MAKATRERQKSVGRVMHEFKHHELKSGPTGKGGPVKSRRQAIAIALSEAGESKSDSPAKRREALARSKQKESRGETYQQVREGKSHVGARGRKPAATRARER